MNIFERIITEDQGIMKEYENIVNPIFDYITYREKDIINNPDKNKGSLVKTNNGINVYQYEIPQENISSASWFDNLTIVVRTYICDGGSLPSHKFNIAAYSSTKSSYINGKIENGLIEVQYSPHEKDYLRKALGHEFMHLYEDYNRLKNKFNKGEDNKIPSMLQLSNESYKNIVKLAQDSDTNLSAIGTILYCLVDSERNAIVQEIYTLVKNNLDIDKDNYKEILCKESNKYNNIIIIRDKLLNELKRMNDETFVDIQSRLGNIFTAKCNPLAFKGSFINYVEESLTSLIKKVNRAIYYGIEKHSIIDYYYRDEPIITSFNSSKIK